jgi:hypothetical protein
LDDRNAGSKRTHKVVFDGMSEPVENTRTEPLSGNYQLLQDSTDDAARMEAARLDRYMRYAAAPRTQGSEPEHAHPPIPAYLTNPTVFADANLGTAMIATWNKEQWVFRIVNGGWVSYRRTDPWFIDTSCPGCISDNAPHFAKCTTPKKPVNTDTSSGDFQKAVAAQPQPAPRPNLELISAAICKEVYGPYMATVDAGHREIAVKSIVKILEPFFTAIPAQKRGEIIE